MPKTLRRYKETATALDGVLAMGPKDITTRVRRASVDFQWRADPKPLHAIIDTVLAQDPKAAPLIVFQWLELTKREGDQLPLPSGRSLLCLRAAVTSENIPFPNAWCEGLVARLRGSRDELAARAAFASARNELEQTLRGQSDYAAGLCALGVVDAALGNKEDAIREGERAVELLPVSKSAVEAPMLIQYLAVIYAWTGDKDRAIERLAEAAKLPGSHVTYGHLRLNPFWDPLRGDPRFEAIVASLAPKVRFTAESAFGLRWCSACFSGYGNAPNLSEGSYTTEKLKEWKRREGEEQLSEFWLRPGPFCSLDFPVRRFKVPHFTPEMPLLM